MPIGGSGGGSGKANSSAIKAGEAFVEVSADDTLFVSTMKKIGSKISSVGGKIRNIGLGVAAAGSAITAPLIGTFTKLVEKGDAIQKVVEQTDASAEAISRLGYAGKFADIELEDVVVMAKNLAKATVAASKGSEDQAAAFAKMGVSASDFAELDLDQKVLLLADTLEGIQDPLAKDQFLFATLGKSALKFKQLAADGADDIRKKFGEAGIVSGADAKKSAELVDEMDRVWGKFKSTVLSVGLALFGFSDEMHGSADIIVNVLAKVKEFIVANKEIIRIIFLIGAGLVVGGTAMAVFGVALQGIVAGIAALIAIGKVALAVVFAPLTIQIAAVAAAFTGLYILLRQGMGLLTGLDGLGDIVVNTFTTVFDTLKQTFETAFRFLAQGNFQKAWDTIKVGGLLAFKELELGFVRVWNKLKESFVDGFRDAATAIKLILTEIGKGVVKGFTFFITSFLRGAQILASRLELHSLADKLARAEESVQGISDTFSSDIDKEFKQIQDQRKQQQQISDDARKADEKAVQNDIDALKAELDRLKIESIPPEELPKAKKITKMQEDKLFKIADATAGLFASRDYRGALGLGPATDVLKDQAKTQKDMLKELQKIEKKVGPPVFE